jgi:cell division protein FtsN
MRNKLKIVAAVVALIAGMVLYKQHSDKKEAEKKDKSKLN